VISTGTSLDTARLRALLSQRLGVVSPAIHANVIGEHGESAVVNWSAASVGGMPLATFLEQSGKEMSRATRDLVLRSVVESAKQIKEGKGATQYGIGSAIGRICQAIANNSQLVLSVATVQPEVEGVAQVCVSLPMVIGADGARLVAYPRLDQEERDALHRSAQVVKEAVDSVLAAL
jgi:L-lactate dehydrogenase